MIRVENFNNDTWYDENLLELFLRFTGYREISTWKN
jgi:hypothetical protein